MTDLLAAVRQLQELQEAATPGPWTSYAPVSGAIVTAGLKDVAVTSMVAPSPQRLADAEYIAAARNLVGPLIEDWERRGAEVENRDEQLRRVDDALGWKYTGMGRVESAERLKRIEDAARLAVNAKPCLLEPVAGAPRECGMCVLCQLGAALALPGGEE